MFLGNVVCVGVFVLCSGHATHSSVAALQLVTGVL